MIITIRGPSGAGKSTVARQIMAAYPRREPVFAPSCSRRRPIGLVCWVPGQRRPPLGVIGHYEIANGGMDTLGTLDEIYATARSLDDAGSNVLMEGKCMSDGLARLRGLIAEGREVATIYLASSVNLCAASVARRGHNISLRSIERVHSRCAREVRALMDDEGVTRMALVNRDRAARYALAWLGMGCPATHE